MIRRTEKLQHYLSLDLSEKVSRNLKKIRPDVLARAAAFLLIKDSKASYAIEGERPPQNRAQRWGKMIGEAGHTELNADELLRLQQIVIDNPRFVKLGWRTQGGFVGEHDRGSGDPMPDHISARWQDLPQLMQGLLTTNSKLESDPLDPVLVAAMIAFGFVFIHPFVDGNGRIHRYLIHDVLIRKKFVKRGLIFPISSVMLERLGEYREILEAYSLPILDFIKWRTTKDHNVEVLNDTADLYRYFDATGQAEFLYDCVFQTVEQTIPEEVRYLEKYDLLKSYLDDRFEMPDKTVALLLRFLEQGKGKLSQRSRDREFKALNDDEVGEIEMKYEEIFVDNP
jgi:Fic family protein